MTEEQQQEFYSFCLDIYASRDEYSRAKIVELIRDKAVELTEQKALDSDFKEALDELYRSRLNNKPTKNRQ